MTTRKIVSVRKSVAMQAPALATQTIKPILKKNSLMRDNKRQRPRIVEKEADGEGEGADGGALAPFLSLSGKGLPFFSREVLHISRLYFALRTAAEQPCMI